MIAPLLALFMAPAPVYVEVAAESTTPQAHSLRDQLMLRLLEEGYPLAPTANTATRTLRVDTTDSGIRVEAEGEDIRRFEVTTGPVLPLEAVHRAMEALDEVIPRSASSAPTPRRYAVHVQSAPAETSPEVVRRALVRSLLDQKNAVVPLDADPDAVLCAQGQGDALELSRGANVDSCGPPTRLIALPQSEPDRGELDDSVEDLIDAPAPAQGASPGPDVAAPSPRTTGLTVDQDDRPDPRAPAIRIGVRTGIYGRLSSADAAVGTTMRVGREPGPGGLLDVLMLPTSAPDISIFETSIGAGFGWTWAVTSIVGIHLQGIAGLQIHRYRQRGAQTGHRYDWTAEIPVGTSLRLARGLTLDLAVRGGRTGRGREHRVDDVVVWSRNAWRIGASVGLSYGWRPR